MIVVDASVAVKWFAPEAQHGVALDFIDSSEDLIAPDLIVFEVLNALRSKLRRNEITLEQYEAAPALLSRAIIELTPQSAVVKLASSLAISLNHPIYDCAYVACALMNDAQLVTADKRLLGKLSEKGLNHVARPLASA